MKCCNANDLFRTFFDFLPFVSVCLCQTQRLQMSIDFTFLQREFLGLLTFGFQLVKTNVTEKKCKYSRFKYHMANRVSEYFFA